jgi:hypothetical protein
MGLAKALPFRFADQVAASAKMSLRRSLCTQMGPYISLYSKFDAIKFQLREPFYHLV